MSKIYMLSDSLITTVKMFHEGNLALEKHIAELNNKKTALEEAYRVHLLTMNMREKYFGGWFWGNKEKVQREKLLFQSIQSIDSAISGFLNDLELRKSKLLDIIKEYLTKYDDTFKNMSKVLAKNTSMKNAADEFLSKVEYALSEINSAQSIETLDLFTKNKAISILSTLENSSAQSAVDQVKSALPEFQEAFTDYVRFVNEMSDDLDLRAIDDSIDLIFDFVMDGFDFMSIFTLSSLSNAESNIEELKSKVLEIKFKVDSAYERSEAMVREYVFEIKIKCLSESKTNN